MSQRLGGRRRAAGLVLVLVAVAGCSDDSSSVDDPAEAEEAVESDPADEPELFEGADFYQLPEPLPEGEPGKLLRYEPLDGYEMDGASAWRIMYLSESLEGERIAVTGTVLVPEAPAPEAGRKLLTIAHGTTGVADECAPSHAPNVSELSLSGDYVAAGYVVVMSDYEGLGTPGRHPYLVGESEGRSVLDAAKAASELPVADVGEQYAIIGYSQGGHGALWAHELAGEWGPEMELVGTVAGAPATEIPTIFAAGEVVGGFFVSMVAGYEAAYPEADPALVLSESGQQALAEVDNGCIRDVFAAVAAYAGDGLVQPEHTTVEPWAELMEANNPGQVAVDEPVLILHSAADTTVPAALSEQLFNRMCEQGQVVERRVYEEGQDHGGAVPSAYADGLAWMEGLMEGATPISTCP
jgi:alpha-beta hydrolase superfamily lysophospholipase